jgi:hypothetical protein
MRALYRIYGATALCQPAPPRARREEQPQQQWRSFGAGTAAKAEPRVVPVTDLDDLQGPEARDAIEAYAAALATQASGSAPNGSHSSRSISSSLSSSRRGEEWAQGILPLWRVPGSCADGLMYTGANGWRALRGSLYFILMNLILRAVFGAYRYRSTKWHL